MDMYAGEIRRIAQRQQLEEERACEAREWRDTVAVAKEIALTFLLGLVVFTGVLAALIAWFECLW